MAELNKAVMRYLKHGGGVRSAKEVKEGLVRKAFAKGQEAGEKMELLTEWRSAACAHDNHKISAYFRTQFKTDSLSILPSSGSRGIDAFNWIAKLEGRDDRLADSLDEKKIADMERMHHMSRFFKNSEIKVDIEALVKASRQARDDAPIIVDLPKTLINQRNKSEVVYSKSEELPAYMTRTLSEIDEQVDKFDGDVALGLAPPVDQEFTSVALQSKAQEKRPRHDDLVSLEIPKLKYGFN